VRKFSCHPLGYYWVLVATLLLVLTWNGFCLLDLRFLSDREFIDAAVRDVLTSTAIIETPTGGFAQFVPEEPRVPYGSLAEFHHLNREPIRKHFEHGSSRPARRELLRTCVERGPLNDRS
jgi:hypothetical protein